MPSLKQGIPVETREKPEEVFSEQYILNLISRIPKSKRDIFFLLCASTNWSFAEIMESLKDDDWVKIPEKDLEKFLKTYYDTLGEIPMREAFFESLDLNKLEDRLLDLGYLIQDKEDYFWAII